MAEEPLPEQPAPAEGAIPLTDEAAPVARTQGRNRKLMLILGVVAIGGTILGIGGTVVISSLFKEKPAAPVTHETPTVAAAHHEEKPLPDPHQETMIKELKERNEKLEAQVKEAQEKATLNAAKEDPKPAPPPKVIYRTLRANEKEKVTEDCNVTNNTEGLGDRLKNCIEEFNNATR